MIPRVIHQIWLGESELPPAMSNYSMTWKKLHPNWKHYLWTEPPFTLINQSCFDVAKTLAQKADILRYELLFHFGGVYVDMDTECLKSFEALRIVLDAFAGFESEEHQILCNAVLGSRQHSDFMHHLIRDLSEAFSASHEISHQTGPCFLTKQAKRNSHLVACFPESYFYPRSIYTGRTRNLSSAFCIHHWHASWR